jgi:hypothetical protein
MLLNRPGDGFDARSLVIHGRVYQRLQVGGFAADTRIAGAGDPGGGGPPALTRLVRQRG